MEDLFCNHYPYIVCSCSRFLINECLSTFACDYKLFKTFHIAFNCVKIFIIKVFVTYLYADS